MIARVALSVTLSATGLHFTVITMNGTMTDFEHPGQRTGAALRLELRPVQHGRRFEAGLEGDLICASDQPLLDGARELLGRGFDPATLLTTRHAGKNYDNFLPKPIGELAKWTVENDSRGAPRFRKYRQLPFGGTRLDARWPLGGREIAQAPNPIPGVTRRAADADEPEEIAA